MFCHWNPKFLHDDQASFEVFESLENAKLSKIKLPDYLVYILISL